MLKFLPGKLPGSSTARLGLATTVNGAQYTIDAPAPGGRVRLVDAAGLTTVLPLDEVIKGIPNDAVWVPLEDAEAAAAPNSDAVEEVAQLRGRDDVATAGADPAGSQRAITLLKQTTSKRLRSAE